MAFKRFTFESPFQKLALTFDDVLLQPNESDVLPHEVTVATRFSRGISLHVPVVSAAMDTVTESSLAIALAQVGGIGVVHRNMAVARQVEEVVAVKRFESVMIANPVTLQPQQTVKDALALMAKMRFSGFPVTENGGRLVGILTNRDLRFAKKKDQPISEVMTKEGLITAPEGTSLTQAQDVLHKHRIEKLPVVDQKGYLKGLITMKDIEKRRQHPESCKDELGRLRVAAAVGTGLEAEERVAALTAVGVDAIVVDTAHGHSKGVMEVIKKIRKQYPKLQLVAGNLGTAEGTAALIKLGVDGVKVGIGPGSICTTRIVAGIGVPQLTAVYECAQTAKKSNVPIIADGGIRYSGDMVKALAAGASCVMLGNLLAGTDESPGEVVFLEGRRFKVYHAMGSLAAMKRGSDRYPQADKEGQKFVPEGVEGRVAYRGSLSSCVFQLVGGVKAGMGYSGARTLTDLQKKARFVRITNAGLQESHPHHIAITSEPPNYWLG